MTPSISLNDGTSIPQLGFGVFQIPPEDTVEAVRHALETGYRHVDTAKAYGNEAEVGEAVRAIDEHVYVTTKLFNDDHGYDAAKAAFDASFERLGLDHVDLYLIHWPVPSQDKYVETWKALTELRGDRLRSVGVSNFQPAHLDRIIDETAVTPVINQIELHPYLQQSELRAYHAEHDIVTEAWSPLAQGGELLEDEVITSIADAHGRTPGQVVLRWHIQLGNVIFPKSTTPERIEQNFAIFDFELSDEDMDRIAGLDRGERIGPDPDTFVSP